ncbi:3' terminal RNA ribose 2'-O-methyltransferase Hen1 [Streptomonospora litoralis]|uniref:Small RNA 2'-O-methyltransferase n=1 Tax=Streptomonospora litoralis TaxID=2498135 RepID=A0A4P6PVV1_9ACTN|nr:3' terminal RNA ribose 2'-O-methyltransferase Hen1 [Streptomonospora litoralis]QBI52366.1 bifunctional 3-demethylubiquinone-9 3-methyltransferase/ 2-octaprenyl-6-hydroxy phenol methylase [Streptomonospora litoralis]
MLLTITTTREPATDLGFLLHKHPDRIQRFTQSYGTAHVFYPEAEAARCTAALLLEVEPAELLRTRKAGAGSADFSLARYVNDRPYAASSLFAVAVGDVFRSALRGTCKARPELAAAPLPLTLSLPAVPCPGGPDRAHRLFEPLGWQVDARPAELDPGLPGWGDSRYVGLTLTGELRLADALSHLYVLLPVLDGAKHYWVGPDEIDKLLRAGERWLPGHPERTWITRRYLARQAGLVRTAVARLSELDDRSADVPDDAAVATDPGEEEPPPPGVPSPAGTEAAEHEPSQADRRAGAVLSVLEAEGVRSVLDIGCGSGKLLARLLDDPGFTAVVGADVSAATLEQARRRLRVDRLPERDRRRLDLFTASALYSDPRFRGYDAAVLMEVVEHIDPARLPVAAEVVFGRTAPRTVVVTTPNAEYNRRYEWLPEGAFRHTDHRFEWTRAEFRAWAGSVADTYGYRVRHLPVGPEDPEFGASTQMGVFTK